MMTNSKTHPPKADAWPLVSPSAYRNVPSPKLLACDWLYAGEKTHSWATSTEAEPATGLPKPSTASSN